MTNRYAVIDAGTVENTILAEAGFTLPGKTLVQSDTAAIGDLWDGATFSKPPAPPAPVPQSVTPRQARLALLAAGLLPQVEAAIATGNEADRITWEYALEIKRTDDMITNIGSALGLTSTQIDDLFRDAAGR